MPCSTPRLTRRPAVWGLWLATLALAACGGKPFEVRTSVTPPPAPSATAEAGGVALTAAAITDEDFLNDTFDANLVLAGVLPVRLKIENHGDEALEIDRARFELVASGGRRHKLLRPRDAFKRLISYYDISMYSKEAYAASLADFSSYGLDVEAPLAPGASRAGLLFFAVPADAQLAPAATLRVRQLGRRATEDGRFELRLDLNPRGAKQ